MDRGPSTWRRRLVWTAGAALAAALSLLAPVDGQAQIVLAITAAAMVLWISEVLPLAITALAASFALVMLADLDAKSVFSAYFDPVIVLLLGGFFLGVALSKHGLDTTLADIVMDRAGTRPGAVLLALMGTTAVFSMWISNTAATAIMLPIALGVLAVSGVRQSGDNLARCLVLGIAAAANIGGIATPIGTTANPIALRFLGEAGHSITFLGWMARTVPVMMVMVLLAWIILLRIFPPGKEALHHIPTPRSFDKRQTGVVIIFAVTVMLWLTTDWHGISSAMVALVPVIALFASGLLQESDIAKAGWPTLLLIGGGLALGDAVTQSGLDGVFAGAVEGVVGGGGRLMAFAVIATAAVALTLFSSNTAAAVIMVPIAIRLATTWDVDVTGLAMLAAVALSMDFLVPVGTPPNAMAYSTGHVSVAQMVRSGSIITLVAVMVTTAAAWAFW